MPTVTPLDQDRVAHETMRLLADQDLARLGRLLETLGHVDRFSRDEQMALRMVSGDHLAGVHADPGGEPDAPRALELVVENSERLAHLDGRPDGAQGVVLVQNRNTEDGHDGIADVLLDDAAMTLDDPAHLAEVACQQVSVRLWIELPGSAVRRVDQVGEDDGDGLAHVGGGVCGTGRCGSVSTRLAPDAAGPSGSSSASWRRIACSSSRSGRLGSIPSSSTSKRRSAGRLQRLRLAPGAVERAHQLATQLLSEWMRGDERLELADEIGMATEPELELDPLADDRRAEAPRAVRSPSERNPRRQTPEAAALARDPSASRSSSTALSGSSCERASATSASKRSRSSCPGSRCSR